MQRPTRTILGGRTMAGSLRKAIDDMNLPEHRGTIVIIDEDYSLIREEESLMDSDLPKGRGTVVVSGHQEPAPEPLNLFPRNYMRDVVRSEHPEPVVPGFARQRGQDGESTKFNTHRLPNWRSRRQNR